MAATNLIPKTAVALPATNDLRDIKPPIEIPSGWGWVLWALAALAAAALLFWAWRYWQKRRAQLPVIPVIPPHIRAKEKLQEALALIAASRILHTRLRHHPLLSGAALHLPRPGAHHRGIPLRTPQHQLVGTWPKGQPRRIPQTLRPCQIRPLRTSRARTARPARFRLASGRRN